MAASRNRLHAATPRSDNRFFATRCWRYPNGLDTGNPSDWLYSRTMKGYSNAPTGSSPRGVKRTGAELTERIYGLTSNDEGYNSCYSRIRRKIRSLESKGLVSRSLFGNNKPFRLTELAIINLAKIGGKEKQLNVIPRVDLVVYIFTIALAIPVFLLSACLIDMAELSIIGMFRCFCFLLGLSFCRIVQSVRRVF